MVDLHDVTLFAESDSKTIQNAIDRAVADGSRTLTVPRYNARTDSMQWRISQAIRIPSCFTLILDNCYMVMETGVYDHMFTNAGSDSPAVNTLAGEDHDITILGKGNVCLDGGEHNHLLEKTSGKFGFPRVWKNTMFLWVNVRNLRVENLHIENQRWWAITHVYCRHVTIKDINFDAIPHVPNMDGIDLRVGCHDFDIQNITGRTGDDVIAMTGLKANEYTWWQVEGEEPHIHDVKIRNVQGDPFIHLVIRFLNHDGVELYNIDVDTVMDASDFTTKKRPHATVDLGCILYSKVRKSTLGETHHIRVRNVTARGETAIRLNNQLSDAVFTNVKTFGDNIDAIGTQGKGCELRNVVMEDVYYGSTQQEIFVSTALSPDKYHGAALDMTNITGELTVKGLHIDKVRHIIKGNAPVQVTVEDLECGCCLKQTNLTGGAKLTVDGEDVQ